MDEDRPDPSVGGSVGEDAGGCVGGSAGGGGGGVGGRMGEAGRRFDDDDGVDAVGGSVAILALGIQGEAFVDLLTEEDDFFGDSELEG